MIRYFELTRLTEPLMSLTQQECLNIKPIQVNDVVSVSESQTNSI